jgi:branched-chain amino acid transport system substrate-binding protein
LEKAGTTDTDRVRKAMERLSWPTPQGTKTMGAGDHQAIQDMYVVQVTDGRFKVISQVPGPDAIGPNTCNKW